MRTENPIAAKCYALMCVLMLLINLAVFWPGVMSYDSIMQWHQVESGFFTNQHPPLMAWWWGFLYHHVIGNVGVLMTFHVLLYWAAIYVLGAQMLRYSRLAAYLCLALWFLPPLMSMTAMIWKDTGMAVSFLFAFALIFRSYIRNARMHPLLIVLTFTALLYGTAVRHNACYALLPLCLLFAECVAPHARKVLQWCLCFLLIIAIITSARMLNDRLTDKYIDVAYWHMLTQLVGVSQKEGINLIPESVLARRGMSAHQFLSDAHHYYDIAGAAEIANEDPDENREIRTAFWQMLRTHPTAYLKYRAEFMWYLLRFDMGVFYPYYWDEGISRSSAAKAYIGKYWEHFRNSWLFRPWLYLALAMVMLVPLMWGNRNNQAARAGTVLLTSGFFYVLPYIIILNGTDFRYVYWQALSALLAFPFALAFRVRKNRG